MRRLVQRTVKVIAVLAMGACGTDAPSEKQGTDATTRALLTQPVGASLGASTQIRPGPAPGADEPMIPLARLGFDMGVDDAPVRVVELSDYGCGYCRQFHLETFPTLREEFIESGKVAWKFIPFINGMFPNSLAATEAAECTLDQGDELFETLTERLWADQASWKQSGEAEAVVRGMAEQAGVDLVEFDACMADDRNIERIANGGGLARQLGVRGTPTFFVLGYPPIQGALPTELFQEVLQLIYQEATPAEGN